MPPRKRASKPAAKKAAGRRRPAASSKQAAPELARLSVNATLAEVRAHPETAAAVLEAEEASGAPRPSLVRRLQRMVGEGKERRGRKPPPDPHLLDVLEARRGGAGWTAIAESLKYPDVAAVERAFAQAMQMLEVTSVANQIVLEHERLDRLQATLWPKALRGDVEALGALLRILDQRAGLPRPLDLREDRILGPVERATDDEVSRLKKHAPALAAAALVLARAVDDNAGDPDKAAGLARELRISMTQLRGLAGTRVDDDDEQLRGTGTTGVVVPAGRLEQLRGKVDRGYRAP